MNRRKFLRSGSLLSIGLPTVGALTATQATANVAVTPAAFEVKPFELDEVTIEQLQQKMKKGELTSLAITNLYLKRIAEIDKAGPQLNSVIELNPDAAAIAASMDAERRAGTMRGPMHGIPILLKDNIDTGDKMMTTAGSLALEGNRATKDAFIVQQLRKAGVVILGKVNLSEFANFRSSRSTSGWSSRGGQTRCPYILNRNPSGSSAGSGTAVAANLCAAAIGTETDGSIVSPASVNSLVGIKPTVGLVSRSGIIPISATQDTAGPMARTVKDAAFLLAAITGVDGEDAVTKKSAGKAPADYTTGLNTNGLKGKRIGIEKAGKKGNPDVTNLYKKNIDLLKAQGAILVEIELSKLVNPLGDAEYDVLLYEFKDGLNKYLASANASVKSLNEVIAYNKLNEATAMPYFKQDILETSQQKGGLSTKAYKDALAKSLGARKIIDDMLALQKLDAIVGITNGPAVCIDLVNGDYGNGFSYFSPAAMAGYPHITVPMGLVHHLPVGLSFFAGAYKELQPIQIAYAFEQASKARVAPTFREGII